VNLQPLVIGVYDALARGDADALGELLDPDFEAHFADGLPLGIGGRHVGAAAAMRGGWWAIGRAYSLRAVPEEWIPTADGRLLVLGVYRGSARATGAAVEAGFAHLWTAAGGRLVALRQLTDTARWVDALADPGAER
jgi:2-(1,2-epoxy-1,2-dihydrophenyl)acetyl-CoA isomerase